MTRMRRKGVWKKSSTSKKKSVKFSAYRAKRRQQPKFGKGSE